MCRRISEPGIKMYPPRVRQDLDGATLQCAGSMSPGYRRSVDGGRREITVFVPRLLELNIQRGS